MSVALLAREVVREAVRDRWMHAIPLTFVALVPLTWGVRHMAIGGAVKASNDIGLTVVWLVGSLTAVLLGVHALRPRADQVWVLTRPISRSQFALGRFLGVLATLALQVLGLTLAWIAAATLNGIPPAGGLGWFTLLLWVELGVVAGMAALLSNLVGPVLAGLCTVALWVAGHLGDEYHRLVEESGVPAALATTLYSVVPDLDLFDVQQQLVHDVVVEPARVGGATAYGLAWMTALLALTMIVLSRKDLP
ncbi:MAG: ABC transporter permease [Deltaproteobacteria bacterium]|nr:ABC transporter permease [Deltaproteobacteria bacterium]